METNGHSGFEARSPSGAPLATTTSVGVPRKDTEISTTGRRSRKSSQHNPARQTSPIPEVDDPPSTANLADRRSTGDRRVSGPPTGFPTPDPSSDSQSDGELLPQVPQPTEPQIPAPVPTKDPASIPTTRDRSDTKGSNPGGMRRRLSTSKMQEFTAAPNSIPIATVSDRPSDGPVTAGIVEATRRLSRATEQMPPLDQADFLRPGRHEERTSSVGIPRRSSGPGRTLSTPPIGRRTSSSQPSNHYPPHRDSLHPAQRPLQPELDCRGTNPPAAQGRNDRSEPPPPSPIPPVIPLPPMSIPTHLQLELSGQRPTPLYIHHSHANDIPYESNAVKVERLMNFLLLPFYLERAMTFGVAACFDAWLWTFTVLPLRFCIAASVLARWWAYVIGKEIRWLVGFVWYGLGRMWQRGRRERTSSKGVGFETRQEASRSSSRVRDALPDTGLVAQATGGSGTVTDSTSRRLDSTRPTHARAGSYRKSSSRSAGHLRHRRTKSIPSSLTTFHKADLLQGGLLIISSAVLMILDASRMYHFIRAQSAIKLYAIYNLLEVGDKLLSALGQDIMECLLSNETLSRNSFGRSKVLLPMGMFGLALVYNIMHAVVLFYQVIALNVAVNSYSNALLTLLLSNQFVEIKSAVFKRFEKENTFQLGCADIVERFQLWVMLIIIGMRNVVEVGGLSVPGAGSEDTGPSSIPLHTSSILPASFTILPSWLWSGEVLSPFIVVIGSEMVVDWIKHAYINKFNNIKPTFYGRILDILCKDYYTNAFVTPSLTRRLGLPLLPLSCLFIRASIQIYNMFLATHLPTPSPPSTQTSLSIENATPSPAMLAGLGRIDHLIRNALGRSVFGYPYANDLTDNSTADPLPGAAGFMSSRLWIFPFTTDDCIAALTMVVVFLLLFLVLLLVKLLLGMVLLRYARDRYARMKIKEHAVATGQAEKESFDSRGKRTGGYGQVEVGEERRRWIFGPEDPEGLRKAREKDRRIEANIEKDKDKDFSRVIRYEMITRRIW
ncbi:hypothetical protein VTJ83DRAFT_7002 [Remersonia thermophila]|uniref:Uncharacterized protein n=1 Tax=Remersonia thermophila TaxID=72144 RepID=A0ABR4D2G1_9PEZI